MSQSVQNPGPGSGKKGFMASLRERLQHESDSDDDDRGQLHELKLENEALKQQVATQRTQLAELALDLQNARAESQQLSKRQAESTQDTLIAKEERRKIEAEFAQREAKWQSEIKELTEVASTLKARNVELKRRENVLRRDVREAARSAADNEKMARNARKIAAENEALRGEIQRKNESLLAAMQCQQFVESEDQNSVSKTVPVANTGGRSGNTGDSDMRVLAQRLVEDVRTREEALRAMRFSNRMLGQRVIELEQQLQRLGLAADGNAAVDQEEATANGASVSQN
ncbi:MAG: hypothetical protein MHM6MM_007671 [Cercozoa sp. M6MM]